MVVWEDDGNKERKKSKRDGNGGGGSQQASPGGGGEIAEQLKKYKKIDDDLDDDDANAGKVIPLCDRPRFNVVMGAVILVNAALIGLETDLGPRDTQQISDRLFWYVCDFIFCTAYTAEMLLRFSYYRLDYFRDSWNNMDFVLVLLAILDTWILSVVGESIKEINVLKTLRVVRMLRLVRLIRLLRMFKELWLIVNGLIESLKTLGWVSLLLLLFLYVCAIFTTMQIGQKDSIYAVYANTWDYKEFFGTVPKSMYTLFQVLTLESWADGIARHVMRFQPEMVVFFIIYLTFTTFGLLNLVVGVIVENTLAAARNNEEKIRKQQERERIRVLQHLRDIFELADEDGSGALTVEEFREAIRNPEVANKLKLIDLPVSDAEELFVVLDHDGSGELSVDEFIGGCIRLKGNAKSKDLLAVQISVESLAKRLDVLEEKLGGTEGKLGALDQKTQRMAQLAGQLWQGGDPRQIAMPRGGASVGAGGAPLLGRGGTQPPNLPPFPAFVG